MVGFTKYALGSLSKIYISGRTLKPTNGIFKDGWLKAENEGLNLFCKLLYVILIMT